MRKFTSIIFVLILLINLSFLAAMSYPHAFHGTVTIKDGQNPTGQTLIGMINGVATGSCVILNGEYDLVIEDNIGNGGEIEFYIGYEKAEEISEFVTFEVTELNLTFDLIPLDFGDCGNHDCEANECSTCPIDCGIAECIGNGICDIEMGETCSTYPEDCGVCPVPSSGGSSGGGGGGSSGGSSGGGSSSIISTTNENTSTSVDEVIKGIQTLNEETTQKKLDSGMTGAVIGFVKSIKGIGLGFAVVLLVAGTVVFITQKKKGKSNEKILDSSIGDTSD